MRPTIDDIGLMLAQTWSLRGTCVRRQVGCALFDASGHCLSTGYNGPASGQPHCTHDNPCLGGTYPPGQGLSECEAIHAEANALLRCPDVMNIHVCYCTHSPCLDCVKLLLNTGCRHVVFLNEYAHGDRARARWLAWNEPASISPDGKVVFAKEPRTWRAYASNYVGAL